MKFSIRGYVMRPGCLPRRWFGSSARRCCRCNCSPRRTCHNNSCRSNSHLFKKLPFLDGDAGAIVAGRDGKIFRYFFGSAKFFGESVIMAKNARNFVFERIKRFFCQTIELCYHFAFSTSDFKKTRSRCKM